MREHLKEPRRPPKIQKKYRKGEREQHHYPFHHTCASSTYTSLETVFSCYFSSITMWGINVIELGLYIPRMSLLKCCRSSWASKLDAPPLVPVKSFHTLIALCASVVWQSLLLLHSLPFPLFEPLFFTFQTPIIILFAITSWCQNFKSHMH